MNSTTFLFIRGCSIITKEKFCFELTVLLDFRNENLSLMLLNFTFAFVVENLSTKYLLIESDEVKEKNSTGKYLNNLNICKTRI